MTKARAKIFWTGRSQAIRLPNELQFDVDEVLVRREGNAIILEPFAEWPAGWVESFLKSRVTFKRPKQPQQGPRKATK